MMFGLAGCVSQGKPGEMGDPGPQGPPGDTLAWKDASGAVVANMYPTFTGRPNAVVVDNGSGVFFEYSALGGTPIHTLIDSTNVQKFYLSSNCTGDVYAWLPVQPTVAFKYDNRLVAMPKDIEVLGSMGSYSGSTCNRGPYGGDFTKLSTVQGLPTLTQPQLPQGPYHMEKI